MAVKRRTKSTTGVRASGASRPTEPDNYGARGLLPSGPRAEELALQDQAEFEEMQRSYIEYFQPAGEAESRLVDEMCEGQCRLRRVSWIETGLYALALLPSGESSSGPRLFTTRELERAVGRLRRYEGGLLMRFERALLRLNRLQCGRPARAVTPEAGTPASAVGSPKPGPQGPDGWTM